MTDKKQTTEDPLADLIGQLVSDAQRGDLAAVRGSAQQLVDAIDEPTEETEEAPKEGFRERFSRALDASVEGSK